MADGGQSELPPKVYPEGKVSKIPSHQEAVNKQLEGGRLQHPTSDDTVLTHLARNSVATGIRTERSIAREQKKDQRIKDAEALTMVDPLTGLPNRRWLDKELEIKTAQARRDETDRRSRNDRRTGKKLYGIFIDIDHFKWINEQYGHQIGDDILQEMSKLGFRTEEPLARYGGEEFVQLIEDVSDLKALLKRYSGIMKRNSQQILEGKIVNDHEQEPMTEVTFSYGIAIFDGTESGAEFLKRADIALKRAKTEGRNRGVLTEVVNGETVYHDIDLQETA